MKSVCLEAAVSQASQFTFESASFPLHWAETGQLFTLGKTLLLYKQFGGGILLLPLLLQPLIYKPFPRLYLYQDSLHSTTNFPLATSFSKVAGSKNDFFMLVSRFAREGLLAKSCPSWPGSVNRGEKVVIKLFNGAQ